MYNNFSILKVHEKNGQHVAYGIVSLGYSCGRKNATGFYTNIISHLPWIKNVVKKNQNHRRPNQKRIEKFSEKNKFNTLKILMKLKVKGIAKILKLFNKVKNIVS